MTGLLPTLGARPTHWSSWMPASGSKAAVTSAIAAHLSSTYLLDGTGKKLVEITGAAAGRLEASALR